MTKRFSLVGDESNGELDCFISDYDSNSKTVNDVIGQLNYFEEERKRKNKQIAEFRKREGLYMDVIYGVKAYLRLVLEGVLDE